MIKIRLARLGKRNAPFYRIVAIDERSKREGRPLEVIGSFNPTKKSLKIDKEKLTTWVKKGAQMTGAVRKLINSK